MENFLKEYSKLLDEGREHLSYETIAVYLNLKENLSSREISFIERHLEKCSACKKKLDTVREEDMAFDSGFSSENSTPLHSSPNIFRISGYWKYAAAAIVMIGLTALLYFYFTPEDKTFITQDSGNRDSVITNEKDAGKPQSSDDDRQDPSNVNQDLQDFASLENFNENRVLENFINRNVRSETPVELYFPSTGDTVNTPINFKWRLENGETAGNQNSFKIIVVDNKNRMIYENNTEGLEIKFSGKLAPGLYYWKIESKGTLQAVGKFYIKQE